MNDDLRAAAQAATPGPWHTGSPFDDGCVRLVDYSGASGGTDPANYFGPLGDEVPEVHSPSHLIWQAVWHNDSTAGNYARPEDMAYIALASPDRILAVQDENKEFRVALLAIVDHTRAGRCEQAYERARAALAARESPASSLEGKPE